MTDPTPPTDLDALLGPRLAALPAPATDHWAHLRAALRAAATAADLVDVAYATHATPLGDLVVGATAAGIVRVGLPSEDPALVLGELASRISPRVLAADRDALTRARHQLDEYFAGRRHTFDLPLDWRLTTGFRREVLRATAAIPYGDTRTYRDLATTAGSPRAVRATGTALATNPLPILVPCHRVVPSTGGLGNYRGGAAAKAQLLDLERAG